MGEPQGFDRNGFLHRIGTFFLLVGIGLLVFFFLSDAAQKVVFDYLCWGLILTVLGFIFRARLKRTVSPSGRFGVFKRMAPKPKQEQGKK
jgi:hypothetical protein